MLENPCIIQTRAEPEKSALPICNYSQILYRFFEFTQNLKQSRMFSWFVQCVFYCNFPYICKTVKDTVVPSNKSAISSFHLSKFSESSKTFLPIPILLETSAVRDRFSPGKKRIYIVDCLVNENCVFFPVLLPFSLFCMIHSYLSLYVFPA